MPKSLDSPAEGPWQNALLIDLGLLSLFALQHSIMARPAFKRIITRVISAAVEHSTYVLASSIALLLLFWQWRPLGGTVWQVHNGIGTILLYGGFVFGWLLVLFTTFVINHFDLFGLRQVWRHLRGKPQAGLQFETPFLYRIVRHPLYVGWFFAFWSAPVMTATHLLFAMATTAYILVAIQLEERDLMAAHPEVCRISRASAHDRSWNAAERYRSLDDRAGTAVRCVSGGIPPPRIYHEQRGIAFRNQRTRDERPDGPVASFFAPASPPVRVVWDIPLVGPPIRHV